MSYYVNHPLMVLIKVSLCLHFRCDSGCVSVCRSVCLCVYLVHECVHAFLSSTVPHILSSVQGCSYSLHVLNVPKLKVLCKQYLHLIE